MFLLYTAPGAVVPLFSLRLKELGFSPGEIGWCCATPAIGTLLSPLIAGHIADRWFAAEKCLAVCSFLSAGLLWLLAGLTSPTSIFVLNLMLWLAIAPALTLSTSTCFVRLRDPARQFGRVRMWGTVGWVAPGWFLGFWLGQSQSWQPVLSWLRPAGPGPELADAFRLAALLAALFGCYTLTLPHTPPKCGGKRTAPFLALRELHGRAFAVYAICTFGVAAALPFSTQLAPLLLEELGILHAWIPRLLTLAQASEIVSLFILPGILYRFGLRGTMRLGLFATILTLGGLGFGEPLGLVLAALCLYGLCISCYLVAGQMYLNQRIRPDARASAQGLHSTLCGLGMLFGNLFVGQVRSWADGELGNTFAVGAGLACCFLLFFTVTFPRETPR